MIKRIKRNRYNKIILITRLFRSLKIIVMKDNNRTYLKKLHNSH